jgi:hypothetical protein
MAGHFIVQDATGQNVAWFYFRDDPTVAPSAAVLIKEQARRRAVNFAGPLVDKANPGTRDRAVIRAAHGVHERDHRHRRASELAGAAGARDLMFRLALPGGGRNQPLKFRST